MAILLAGCASDLIEVRPGSDKVALAEPYQVASCVSKGNLNVSVLAKVGFVTRADSEIEANLFQLARNGAVDAGADTVVKGASTEYGERTYSMYKCRQ